jgi:hypothetical protein
MSTFRGPVALDEIEKAIGPFDDVILANDSDPAAVVPMTDALGYGWNCGCEARGNGSPLSLWRACAMHLAAASQLEPRAVPARFGGGLRVSRRRVRRVRTGDVVVPAKPEIDAARLVGSPIGYVENGKVIREHADGRREVVASV